MFPVKRAGLPGDEIVWRHPTVVRRLCADVAFPLWFAISPTTFKRRRPWFNMPNSI
jgi:hypothetical protein